MSLDDLNAAVETAYGDLDDELETPLDRETKHELAMLATVLGEDPEELIQRAVHLLFQTTVDTGKLDFHLRTEYDITYDEYLTGMTYDEMTGEGQFGAPDDDRRYQF
ncbi:MAG: hypothetical protein SVG88_03780 [Halobacteriales archaeon]|nr:hypothetical protein [Halobacteriales archaeon]